MKSLLKFATLSGQNKRLFVEALVAVVRMRAGLTFSTYRELERRIPPPAPRTTGVGPGRIAWAVSAMARLVPGATCLTQALAAQQLMARHGKASKIRIGVAQDETGKFTAHAWLMHEDKVVIGGADHDLSRYTSIADLAPGPS